MVPKGTDMLPFKKGNRSRTLSRISSIAFVFLLFGSISLSVTPTASASQNVTLTFRTSTQSTYPVTEFTINGTASVPITGPVKLLWTINGSGPYTYQAQITNGNFERSFGCAHTGNWTLWLVWDGNEQYNYAQSNAVSVQVLPAPSSSDSSLLWIFGIVILAAIIGVVAYVGLKRRKS